MSSFKLLITCIIIAISLIQVFVECGCPEFCECRNSNKGLAISCSSIPSSLPNDTYSFDYSNINGIISDQHFNKGGWGMLKRLVLSTQDIYFDSNLFQGLGSVEDLKIRCSRAVFPFPAGTFSHFTSLKRLDLSENEWINFAETQPFMWDLRSAGVILDHLNLSKTNWYKNPYHVAVVGQDMLTTFADIRPRIVDFSSIGNIVIDTETIGDLKFDYIEVLNISNSHLLHRLSNSLEFYKFLPNIQELRIDGIKIQDSSVWGLVPFADQCTRDLHDVSNCSKFWNNMVPAKLSKFTFDDAVSDKPLCIEMSKWSNHMWCLKGENSLKSVSFKRGGYNGFNFVIIGIENTEELDLRENNIGYISNVSLRHLPNLKYLHLGHNKLVDCQKTTLPYLLRYSYKLERVDFSYNELTHISRLIFANNTLLTYIDLSNNRLTVLDVNLKLLSSLRHLDVSENAITSITTSSKNELMSHRADIEAPFVNLDGNLRQCICETKHTVRDLRDIARAVLNYTDQICANSREEFIPIGDVLVSDLEQQCLLQVLSIALPSCGGVIIVILVIACCYCQRARVFKVYVRWRLYRHRNCHACANDRIFLTYGHKDKDVVLRELYPRLNSELMNLLARNDDVLYINDKDFRVPGYIDEEIVRGVNSTRATVAVVSRSFLDSAWTKLEITYSWIKKKPVIMIFLEKIPEGDLSPVLRYYYDSRTRLVWPNDEGEKTIFWTNLVTSLGKLLTCNGHQRTLSTSENDATASSSPTDEIKIDSTQV